MFAPVLLLVLGKVEIPLIDLHCTLDPGHSRMAITSEVTLASQPQETNKATFFLADQMETPRVRIIEPKELAGEIAPKTLSTHDHDVTYEISLPKPLSAGRTLKLGFEYTSKVDHGFVYLLSAKECLAGGYNTCWFPSVGESRHMLGSLEFTTPKEFLVKASGKEIGSQVSNETRTTRFQILQPAVPTFAAAPFFVTHVDGKVPMTLYLLKDRPIGKEYAAGCSRILDVLTKQNGPYPFPDFAIIETPSPESSRDLGFSGASFEGFMFADSSGIDDGFNLAYYGHEVGHQWWGNLVGLIGDKGQYIFSEGLAQFGSLQCVRAIAGPELAEQYRRWGYPRYSDRQCLFGSLFHGIPDVDRALLNPPRNNSVNFHQLANSKGFLVWETLARTMGHGNFAKALQAVTKKYAWTSVTWDQLMGEMQNRTSADMKTFQAEWFERVGAPCVWCTWHQDGSNLVVTLRQTKPTYHLKMPLVIHYKDGREELREISYASEAENLLLKTRGEVVSCDLDPDFEVYHTTPDLSQMVEDMKRFGDATFFLPFSGTLEQRVSALREALANLPALDSHGAEFLERSALSGLLLAQKKYDEALEQCRLALACPVRRIDLVPGIYLRMAAIAKDSSKGNVNEFLNRYLAAEAVSPWPSGTLARAKSLFPDFKFPASDPPR